MAVVVRRPPVVAMGSACAKRVFGAGWGRRARVPQSPRVRARGSSGWSNAAAEACAPLSFHARNHANAERAV